MNTGTTQIFLIGGIALVLGLLVLSYMVKELARERRRKWILGVLLGTGIIAFALKIGFIVSFNQFPDEIVSLFPEREQIAERFAYDSLPSVTLQHTAYTWQALPEQAPYPSDNPITAAKIKLGRKLFHDTRLSADGTLSCASCHGLSRELAGGDGMPVSTGIDNQKGTRNAPTVLNAAFQRKLFWDGRASSLEEQAKGPIVNPVEMGMPDLASVEAKLKTIPEYRESFADVFGSEEALTIDNVAKAIATYERTLITPDSPYDRFVRGDKSALTAQQLRGMALFESVGCVQCHSGPNFSGASVFNDNAAFRIFPSKDEEVLVNKYKFVDDLGAAGDIRSEIKKGVWRIPSLRNVSRTAPYFHNGSVTDLEEAVKIMAQLQLNISISDETGGEQVLSWSEETSKLTVLNNQTLGETQIKDIVAFLHSLEGDVKGPLGDTALTAN